MYENDAFNLVLRDAIRLGQGRKLHEDMDIYRIVQDFSAHVYKIRCRSDERDWGPHARIWDHGSYLPGPWWSLVRTARDAMFAKVEQLALELRQAEAARADEVTKAAAVVAEILAREEPNHVREAVLAPAAQPAPCDACKRLPGEQNHPAGMIFVGWGRGWEVCRECNGTQVKR